MKNKLFFFPATALALAVLAGCSSSGGAPVQSADGNLSPGIMQPVEASGASNGSWQPEIQQQSMPESMSVQQAIQQPIGQAQTQTQQVQQNVQSAVQQPIGQVQQATQTVGTAVNSQTRTNNASQDFTIPRDSATNAPIYNQIDKGFYKGDNYTVRKGDTMFLIAYISGMDVAELAAKNQMSEPYNLKVGQVLKIGNGASAVAPSSAPAGGTVAAQSAPATTPAVTQPAVSYTPGPNNTQYGSDGTIIGPVKASAGNAATMAQQQAQQAVTATAGTVATAAARVDTTPPSAVNSNISWRWPSSGKVIQGFSSSDGGNKGIDISGSRGQAVNAAAAGRVVYAGNALRGYGNLIIIKHNDDFLSAYAHNESISVKDQQEVSAGQQIAKMGSSGTNSVKLHFEIRYKGKSVDPARYLPSR
ncbi:murein hydrolase activator NlpD [Testudinibacter aquarius]|uniref:Lipoprotein NlpD n=1 Tax=Testudinibacter aquarius TaxID=1524974 RepID=A0A4R3YBH2_9PAST|nr:murein hydrolase activator NlpD [Testudinibacter aquarius]KAE9529903.1 peptidase M23 [Testudinibacter aquarius]TCV89326.1 lipoprotein NlpD [Testudinibacter aquarius]TNG91417.1 murein hydrolase activator NlpD [Testudinibacter aquarius]